MNKVNYKIFLRNDYTNTDGSRGLYLRCNIGGVVKKYSLNLQVKPRFWDGVRMEIKPGPLHFVTDNQKIKTVIIQMEDLLLRLNLNKKPVTWYDIEKILIPPKPVNNSFYDFIARDLVTYKNTYASETIKMYNSNLSKLKRFQDQLFFEGINVTFWRSYQSYLIGIGNNTNTIWKAFRMIKTFINKAIQAGNMEVDPLHLVKVKKTEGTRNYLLLSELRKMEALQQKSIAPGLMNVLKYFLFACYTGLRYRDILDLKGENIKQDHIEILQHKTRGRAKIPLHDKSKRLLPSRVAPGDHVFNVITPQATNRYLLDLATLAKIDKHISFHSARHTFATIALSDLHIPIAVVSQILGHRDIKITQIYAKIVDREKFNNMKKWDSL